MAPQDRARQLSALQIVGERFPEEMKTIQQVFRENETFRSVCEDLAIAIETLSQVDRLPTDIREIRRAEYSEIVSALVEEIRDLIGRSKTEHWD